MGIINKLKNKGKNKVKSKLKAVGIKAAAAAALLAIKLLPTILIAAILTSVLSSALSWIIEIFTAENTPLEIYKGLEIENVADLIEIKGNDDDGWYLDFRENIDDELDKIIEECKGKSGVATLPDSRDFLKKIIKAEVITQFPDLGGEIEEGTDQFQGAIKLRRVTPNKEIGEMLNTSSWETTIDDPDADSSKNQDTSSSLEVETIKSWKAEKKLITTANAIVYDRQESTINPGTYTGYWEARRRDDASLLYVTIAANTTVTYTGNYEEYIDPILKTGPTYIEVKSGNITGYIDVRYVKDPESGSTTSSGTTTGSGTTGIGTTSPTIDTTKGQSTTITIPSQTTTSRAEEVDTTQTTKKYKVAIDAGHTVGGGASNQDVHEGDLTRQIVAKIKAMFTGNSSVEIIDTTYDKDAGVEDYVARRNQATDANADLLVSVHINASGEGGGGSGFCMVYNKAGEGSEAGSSAESKKLGSCIKTAMTSTLSGLMNPTGDIEESLNVIGNEVNTNYPSVLAECGFIDNESDLKVMTSEDGQQKIALGISNGILNYLNLENITGVVGTTTGEETTAITEEKVNEGIESKVYNMKYVSQEKFDELLEAGDEEVLKVFTLDDNFKLVTAKWSYSDGTITYTKNSAIDFRTALKKLTIPIEYLIQFYIDSDFKDFSEALAEVAMDSEIVIAIQDNVTTTIRTITEQQQTVTTPGNTSTGWENVNSTTIHTETCTPSIQITYADTWCVKFYRENSYSTKSLGFADGEDEKVITVKGKSTETNSNTTSAESAVSESPREVEYKTSEGETAKTTVTDIVYQRKYTESQVITNKYAAGDATTEGNESKFVGLYQKYQMVARGDPKWLFDIIENDSKTVGLLNLTKYLIYKATGNSYGVTEYDFSEFDLSKFNSVGGIYGGTIQEKVWFALRNLGYSEIAVAGAMGNIDYESGGFNPAIVEGGSGIGIGLIQWSFGRRTQLEAYAASKGVSWEDEDTQVEFLIAEISGEGVASDYADKRVAGYIGSEGITSTHDDWANATTIEDSTLYFMRFFESPGDLSSLSERIERAYRYYDEFQGRTAPIGGSGDIINTAREVSQYMIDNNIYYAAQTGNDIETTSESDSGYVCATYVAVVLYRSGLLTADQINAYNYHWTGAGGIPDMLEAAGWQQVSTSEAQEGDVCVNYTVHTFIYAGGDLIYDESCAEDMHSIEPYSNWSWYANDANTMVFRAP